nr:DUF5994 family protein [Mycobacterium gastri]
MEQARRSFTEFDTPRVGTPRLRLKPKASRSGRVAGGWWPRGDDLTAELPDLIAVLSFQVGEIARVTYNFNEWIEAPTRLVTGGRPVQLDGVDRQPLNTIEVLGRDSSTIALLVVPWYTDPECAYAVVMAAAVPNDAASIDDLLMISEQDRESRTRAIAAQGRWESQGRSQLAAGSPDRIAREGLKHGK